MSKYAPLRDRLLREPGTTLELTFAEIEALLESPLPRSAHVYAEWWSAKVPHRSQDHAWIDAGWTVASA